MFQRSNQVLFYKVKFGFWNLLRSGYRTLETCFTVLNLIFIQTIWESQKDLQISIHVFKALNGNLTGTFLHQSFCGVISSLKHWALHFNSWFNGIGILISG